MILQREKCGQVERFLETHVPHLARCDFGNWKIAALNRAVEGRSRVPSGGDSFTPPLGRAVRAELVKRDDADAGWHSQLCGYASASTTTSRCSARAAVAAVLIAEEGLYWPRY